MISSLKNQGVELMKLSIHSRQAIMMMFALQLIIIQMIFHRGKGFSKIKI